MGKVKITEESTIKNTTFSKIPDKTRVKIGGVVKSIDVKETSYAPVNRFKGDIAVQVGDEVIVARNAFFPPSISSALINGAKKLEAWDTFEFSLSAIKNGAAWDVEFATAPREEATRSLSLVEQVK